MAIPTVRVYFNFSGTTWTDVSAYLDVGKASVNIRRGRNQMFDPPSAGTATFVLDNSDGRFTPGNTSGAYSPNIRKRLPVRITLDGTASTNRIFVGFVDKWKVAVEGSRAVTVVECSDSLRYLALTQYHSLGVEEAALEANKFGGACWPLADFNDTVGEQWAPWRNTTVGDMKILGGFLGGKPGYFDFTQEAPRFMQGSIELNTDDDTSALGPVLQPPLTFNPGTGGAVGMWFSTETGGILYRMDRQSSGNGSLTLSVQTTDGALKLTATNDSSNTVTLTVTNSPQTGRPFNDGGWHYVLAGVATDGVTMRIFVDGALFSTTAGTARTIGSTNRRLTVGGWWLFGTNEPYSCTVGSFAAVTVFPTHFPGLIPRTWMFDAGSSGLGGEDIQTRLDRLASYVNAAFSVSASSVTSGFLLSGQATFGKSALEVISEMVEAESGTFYCDAVGNLQYIGYGAVVTPPVTKTLSAVQSGVGNNIALESDDGRYFNVLTVDGPAGSVYRENSAGITADGVVSESRTNIVAGTQAMLGDYADLRLTYATDQAAAITQFEVDILSGTAEADRISLCRIAPLTKITITDVPSAVFGVTSYSGVLQGYEINLGLTSASITMDLS